MIEPQKAGSFLLEHCDVVLPDRVIRSGAVMAFEGQILYAGSADRQPESSAGCRRISAEGQLACPSLWEQHVHGAGGISTESMTADSLAAMGQFLAGRGIGAFMPTAVPDERSLASLGTAIGAAADNPDLRGRIPGIHVEGPFVALSRKGGIPESLVRAPSVEYLDRLLSIAHGKIRMMTFAPELPGATAIADRLRAAGVLPSLGHSAASFEELRPYDGVSPLGVTHLFNGMSGVSHKDPGLAQWALLNRDAFVELNCDGTHVHDAAVRLALRVRPWERLIVISDAVAPAGLPVTATGSAPTLYGKPLVARGNGLFYADSGVLVGSRFLVPDCIGRLIYEFAVPLPWAVAMASLNPARLMGFPKKGALLPGYDADVALFSRDFQRCSFLAWEGRPLYEGASPSQAK